MRAGQLARGHSGRYTETINSFSKVVMRLPGYLAGQLRSVSGSSVAVERPARGGQEEPGEGEA